MAIASIVLGTLSLLFAMGGFLTTVVPGVGLVLSFGSPVLAIAGIVCGGVATARAREDGYTDGAATAGLIVSIIAFFPAFLVAVSCGFCNLMCTGAMLNPQTRNNGTPWYLIDGGPLAPLPPLDPNAVPPNPTIAPQMLPAPTAPVDPNAPIDPNTTTPPSIVPVDPNAPAAPIDPTAPPLAPPAPPRPGGAPPPAFPPPPLP